MNNDNQYKARDYVILARMAKQQGIIHITKLPDKPEYTVPKGLLKKGGYYKWRVHA